MRVTGPAAESSQHIGGTLSGPIRAPTRVRGTELPDRNNGPERPPLEVTMATLPFAVALLVVIGLVRLLFFSGRSETPNH